MPQAIPFVLAATAIAGVGLSVYSTIKQSQAQKQIAEAQKRSEALQQSAMQLDNRRRRIEAIRQGQRARAQAVAAATNQGAAYGSGLQGGLAQITGAQNTQLQGLSESLQLGQQNFANNATLTDARASANEAQSFGSLGGALINSLGPIERLSGGFGTPKQSY